MLAPATVSVCYPYLVMWSIILLAGLYLICSDADDIVG